MDTEKRVENSPTRPTATPGPYGRNATRPAMRFFTILEVAERLGVSTRTVRRWIGSGALAVHRLGRLVRVSEADLMAFLSARRGGGWDVL